MNGRERRSAHLLRRIQALPLDGRGHWGARWGARRRGRCLGGAGLAGCRSSDRSLGVAPAPPLAPALGRLKDSPRAPFKRQREGERERSSHPAVPRGAQPACGGSPGACSRCRRRCSRLNLPSRCHRRPVRLARCRRVCVAHGDGARQPSRPVRPSHLRAGFGARGEGRVGGRRPGWRGRRRGSGSGPRFSPRAPSSLSLSLGKLSVRSASLCLCFHFLFPDHDSNTIEGNHI